MSLDALRSGAAIDIRRSVVEVNGAPMRVAQAGDGSLVVLLHGFPECWYSWRYQLRALAEAGFHAVAPNQRGYPGTLRAFIPVAVFDRWLAETGQRPRPGALNWTPMSDQGHAAGGGRTWQIHRRSSMRAPHGSPSSLVVPGAALGRCSAALPTRRGPLAAPPLGHLQHLGGVAAHGGQLQPPQRGIQVRGQRWDRLWGHWFRVCRGSHDAVPSVVLPQLVASLRAQGHGSLDHSALLLLVEQLSGRRSG